MTTKINDANLPDDPAECCQAILDVLGGADGVLDFPHYKAPLSLAQLVGALAEARDGFDRAGDALNIMSTFAEDAARAQVEALHRIHGLARHGTGKYRDLDKRPHGPTVIEVKAAQRVLAARGDDASEEAALRVLGSMEGDDAEAAS